MAPTGSDNLRPDRVIAEAQGDPPAHDRLLDCAMAFWQSAVLVSADELGLFAALASGPLDGDSLERRLGLRQGVAADYLDALVTMGLVERSGGHYCNTDEASLFLDPAKPAYIGNWLAMARTAMREMADLTAKLRVPAANEQEITSLADRMWADIADILSA